MHDLAAGRLHRVEREAKLVAAHLEEHRAFAALDDGRHPAILAAVQLLDADHLGAEVAQHRAAERTGDVPAEIENAYSFQNPWHWFPTSFTRPPHPEEARSAVSKGGNQHCCCP